jgi:hypothetical protein
VRGYNNTRGRPDQQDIDADRLAPANHANILSATLPTRPIRVSTAGVGVTGASIDHGPHYNTSKLERVASEGSPIMAIPASLLIS